jgi:hypothetical protein
MMKVIFVLLAVLVALWASGVDVATLKQGANGVASENARTLTGPHDDWG